MVVEVNWCIGGTVASVTVVIGSLTEVGFDKAGFFFCKRLKPKISTLGGSCLVGSKTLTIYYGDCLACSLSVAYIKIKRSPHKLT